MTSEQRLLSTHAFQVRLLDTTDADALTTLFETVLPGFEASIQEGGPSAFLSDPASFAFGAYLDGGEPAGLGWGVQMRSPSGRLTTYLHELDVLAQHRRQGVGAAIVREAMELARRRGSTRFWLSTGGHNEAAQSLYQSLGGERKPLGDVNYWWTLA